MLTALRETWTYPAGAIVCFAFAAAFGMVWSRLQAERIRTERERRGREELEAYARLDLRVSSPGDLKSLPRRVCSVVAARSPFRRVAMLMYTSAGQLCIAAAEGMDSQTMRGIDAWLEDEPGGESINDGDDAAQVRLGSHSSVIRMNSESHAGGMAILVPIRAGEQRMGALLVCADSILQVPHRLAEEAVVGLEALAMRLGYALESVPFGLQPSSFERNLQTEGCLESEPFSLVMSTPAGRREELRISIQKI